MIIATIRRKYSKGDNASHRRKQHINFDLNALRNSTETEPLKIKWEHNDNNILRNYEDENEWERINRIWKSTKKATRKQILEKYPKTEKENKKTQQLFKLLGNTRSKIPNGCATRKYSKY